MTSWAGDGLSGLAAVHKVRMISWTFWVLLSWRRQPGKVSAVFTGSSVVPDALQQLRSTVLLGGGAGAVEAVIFG